MENQAVKLLEQLASKLGTTGEYLWGVLVQQAPISATITLCQYIVLGIFGWGLWKIHKWLLKPYPKYEHKSRYGHYEEGAVIPMCIAGFAFAILVIVAFCSFSFMFNGYFNPEYWALNKVMGLFK